jgi:hypothetical protein
VLEHVVALVDRSLVLAERSGAESRYRLLETVRQYAAERLAAAGESEVVRRRHAAHFVVRAEAASAARYQPTRDALAAALHADLDNIRAALRWSSERDDDLFVRLAFAHGWCYFAWGLWREGRDWIERARGLPAGAPRTAPRAYALGELGYLVSHQHDFARARPEVTAPAMGLHWLDVAAPELHGAEFRYTLFYGSWNGRIIFDEPMITKAVLESRETVDVTLPPAARYASDGLRAGGYRVYYNDASDRHRVALTQLAER